MKEHKYIPLCTFRGWSIEYGKWVYGHYCFFPKITNRGYTGQQVSVWDFDRHTIVVIGTQIEVHPYSLGIYTGRDDKNGTPIFCGVNGAKYGSDTIEANIIEFSLSTIGEVTHDVDHECFANKNDAGLTALWHLDRIEVISNQWVEHLKATA